MYILYIYEYLWGSRFLCNPINKVFKNRKRGRYIYSGK